MQYSLHQYTSSRQISTLHTVCTPHAHVAHHLFGVSRHNTSNRTGHRTVHARSHRGVNGNTNGNGSSKTAQPLQKAYDVVGLSNLCVDVVVPVQQLPPAKDPSLLQQLTACPPNEDSWELGGNCNFMIAAARMGMKVGSIGHAGNDVYGQYMDRVLQVSTFHWQAQQKKPSVLLKTFIYQANFAADSSLLHLKR